MQVRSRLKLSPKSHQSTFVLALILLFVVLIGVASFAFLIDDNDTRIDDTLPAINQYDLFILVSSVCRVLLASFELIAIFTLFVEYKGGRSGRRYFNDRTIDAVNPNLFAFLGGSLLLRPSIFLFLAPMANLSKKLTNVFFGQKEVFTQGGI